MQRRFAVIAVILGIAAALLLCEAFVRGMKLLPHYEMLGLVVDLDPDVLFRVRSHSGPEINSLGYHDREFPVAGDGRRRILVLGDSFVMGPNVTAERTLSRALERHLGGRYEVFNLGVYGYGPDQSLLRLLEDGLPLDPDVVLLGIFAANDFNDLYKNRLLLLDASPAPAIDPRNPVREALPTLRSAMLVRKLFTGRFLGERVEESLFHTLFVDTFDLLADADAPATREKLERMTQVLRGFRSTLEREGVEFRVFILPAYASVQDDRYFRSLGVPPEDYFLNEEHAARICESLGIEHLVLTEPFLRRRSEPLYDLRDRHLSALGNEVVGSLLAEFLGQGAAP